MTNTIQTSHNTNWLEHLQRLLWVTDHHTLNKPAYQGLTTGLSKLDAMTGGLPKGGITVVAHNGSLQPNWLIWNLALNAATHQSKPVLIWTQRWRPMVITSALAALHCGLQPYALYNSQLTQSQWQTVATKLPALEALPLHLVTELTKSAADIANGVKKFTERWGEPALVVIPDLVDLHRPSCEYRGSAHHYHAEQLLDAMPNSETCFLFGCTTRSSLIRRQEGNIPSFHDISGWPEVISDASLILMPLWHQYWRNATPEHFTQIMLYGKGRHHADIYTCFANEAGLYWDEADRSD